MLRLWNAYSISFAYHSGRIENESVTFNDTREIFEHDRVTSYTGDLRTLFEISNAKDANRYLLESFGKTQPLDEALIKGFQRLLTQNTYDAGRRQLGERPGEYREHRYAAGKNMTGASPEDIPKEMNRLLSEMADVPDEKALTAAAHYHVRFESIHPFADGNGRTGRITMNYFLLLRDHPPVIIY